VVLLPPDFPIPSAYWHEAFTPGDISLPSDGTFTSSLSPGWALFLSQNREFRLGYSSCSDPTSLSLFLSGFFAPELSFSHPVHLPLESAFLGLRHQGLLFFPQHRPSPQFQAFTRHFLGPNPPRSLASAPSLSVGTKPSHHHPSPGGAWSCEG